MAAGSNTDAAIGLISAASLASLFLPKLDEAWQASPGDTATILHLRRGTALYVGFVGALALLYARKAGSVVPILVGAAVAGVVVGMYYDALRTPTPEKSRGSA